MKCNETGINPQGEAVGGLVWWLGTADHSYLIVEEGSCPNSFSYDLLK